MYSLLLILTLYFFSAEAGITTVFGHALLAAISLYGLYYSSRFVLFWILLALVLFGASEPRFSLEYYLWAAGLLGLALSPRWLAASSRKREITLFIAFVIFALADYSRITFSERGSLMIWLPVWLSVIASQSSVTASNESVIASAAKQSRLWLEPLAAAAMLISNKKAALLAYLSHLAQLVVARSRRLIALLVLLLIALGYWISAHPKFWANFLHKSILSRLHIWQSVFNGFLDRPILGHGFGTFAIDFPPYRQHADVLGGHMAEHVAHGHSLPLHLMFELGLVGLALYIFLVILIYRYARKALLPFLVISICDATMVSFNQYLLAALILAPNVIASPKGEAIHRAKSVYCFVTALHTMKLPQRLIKPACYLACTLALIFSTLSVTAHYYYDRGIYSQAIALDPYHSLYHFMRGASGLHLHPSLSEYDLERAVELSPHVSYFYGFLAAAHLANVQDLSESSQDPRLKSAGVAINTAIKYDGSDAYWHTLSSFIHYQNPELSQREMDLALKRNPEIEQLLHDPSYPATEYIGSNKSDVRISSFYRRGAKVFLPLPYI